MSEGPGRWAVRNRGHVLTPRAQYLDGDGDAFGGDSRCDLLATTWRNARDLTAGSDMAPTAPVMASGSLHTDPRSARLLRRLADPEDDELRWSERRNTHEFGTSP